ncbi:flagellar biosynthetic protein FliQ [Proteiniborus ethanoligenes]|uniref:Flagellar biosynthetic protein FliQ n=1 Tax=Proteiniborus ethanoligenes TaxID=415015 RepID=A0A1H3PPV4_9FIRM|nr:flagellar biosynthesis protein FliQ [Proteiniborus ethanoligenes]TAH63129.1 MAG: flagellar biosynthesis protein FliQ [Gottschalkiaceae bacterium]SDZ03066.1 flagellar biosynthetic protein FliQ [Proteiniborus ethanoligenes]
MGQGEIILIAQQALKTILMVSAPMLGFGLLVGLLVSIFQATTQIQEATLAFVPKIIAVFISLLIFGPWILNVLTEFAQNLFLNINSFIN